MADCQKLEPGRDLPDELKALPQWIVWKAQKSTGGKANKIPYCPISNRKTRINKPGAGETYAEAQAALGNGCGYDGVGFILTTGDPFLVLDLDNSLDAGSGELKQWAGEIVDQFQTFTEISPSGKGLHVWCRAVKPGGKCRATKGVEIYDRGRFITVTGNPWPSANDKIADCQDQINELYGKLFGGETEKNIYTGGGVCRDLPERSDDQILAELRGAPDSHTFLKLWAGDWNGLKSSQSEADQSLCYYFARYTEQPEQIERLVLRSGLLRAKWEREDYRTGTILKALELARVHAANGVGEETVSAGPPPFPDVMSGLAGDVAALYSANLESPPHFFYMTTLTCLGAILSGHITLNSELRPQPRMYVLLLGESADDRKSTAISKVVDFFIECPGVPLKISDGVGSAEGLQRALHRDSNLLLVQDELKLLLSKCGIQGSTLLPIISTLFESNRVGNETKDSHICIEDGHLSILAASTLDTYERAWDSSFTDIGLTNRLFLVPGRGERKYAMPRSIPPERKRELQIRLAGVIQRAKDSPLLSVGEVALAKFDEWYMALPRSVHTKRLDTYGHRLMILLAVNDEKSEVDDETAAKVIELLRWQFKVRCLYDPIDADGKVAKMEERIRRHLRSKGPMKERELRQSTSADREGIWFFRKSLDNLRAVRDITQDPKTKKWRRL